MTASSMTKQPQATSWPLVIIIRGRRHCSSRISASGNVKQQFVFLLFIHLLPSRQKKKPGPCDANRHGYHPTPVGPSK